MHIIAISTSTECNIKLTVKFVLQFSSKVNADWVQSTATHIHEFFFFWEYSLVVAAFKSVSKLNTESNAFFSSSFSHILQNFYAIRIFEVVTESFIRNVSIKTTNIIKNVTKLSRTKQSWIQLNCCIVATFFYKIHSYFFDFIRWTTVHCRQCDIVRKLSWNINFIYLWIIFLNSGKLFFKVFF